MPPSRTTQPYQIVEAAVAIIRKSGLASLSARRIAVELGTSTQPVYHSMGSMANVSREVMMHIRSMARDEMRVERTDRHFLNIGMGFAIFARKEPKLFKAFHLDNPFPELIEELFDDLKESLLEDVRFAQIPESTRITLLDTMWTYTLGLSIQICYDRLDSPSDELIYSKLDGTGTAVIQHLLS